MQIRNQRSLVAVLALLALAPRCRMESAPNEEIAKRDARIASLEAEIKSLKAEGDRSNQAKLALFETLYGIETELEAMGVQTPKAKELSVDLETGLAAPQSEREKLAEMFGELRTQHDVLTSRTANAESQLKKAEALLGDLGASERSEFQTRVDAARAHLQTILQENEQLHEALDHYRSALAEAQGQITQLRSDQDVQTKVIHDQETELEARKHELADVKASVLVGRVVIGRASDLLSRGLLRGWRLGSKFPDCTACGCDELDLSTQHTIVIPSSSATVFTIHPADSFELIPQTDGHTRLEILHPDRFWMFSRCLVVSY